MKPSAWTAIAACLPLWAQAAMPYGDLDKPSRAAAVSGEKRSRTDVRRASQTDNATRSRVSEVPYVYPFNAMTGQEVVDQRLNEPRTQLDYINREKVDAYLNGIKDAAHGRDWCLARPVLPGELNLAVVQRLKASRKPAELKENAAPLVLAELRRRFPCPAAGKKKR